MHSLDGARTKIKRAEEQVRDLQTTLSDYAGREPHVVVAHTDPETGTPGYQFRQRVEMPWRVPLLAGEAIQSLRTSLDYLACEAVEANGGTVTKTTAFPIHQQADQFEAGYGRKVEGASDDALKLIQRTEPYRAGNGHALWQLHELNRREKHRLLLTAGIVFVEAVQHGTTLDHWVLGEARLGVPFRQFDPRPDTVFPLTDGVSFFAVPRDLQDDLEFTCHVAFNEAPIVGREPMRSVLEQFIEACAGLVDAMARLPEFA